MTCTLAALRTVRFAGVGSVGDANAAHGDLVVVDELDDAVLAPPSRPVNPRGWNRNGLPTR